MGITEPEVIAPASAHVALDKACHYFGIRLLRAPLRDDFRVDVDWVRDHVTDRTVALVGSAGSYPYGLVDPIEELAEIATAHDVGLHVDGCLGGFVLPWIERLGVDVPRWDFRVPGVTSISADTHKFGYALKGTSVLLYRNADLRRLQYFTFPDWPGGLYVSPGIAGSRSGGLIAAAWAALLTTGEEGYLEAADAIHRTAQQIRAAVLDQPELRLFGDGQTFLVAFGSARPVEDGGVDIFAVNDALAAARLAAQPRPAAGRPALLRHTAEHPARARRGVRARPRRRGRPRRRAPRRAGEQRRAVRLRRGAGRRRRPALPDVRGAGRDVRAAARHHAGAVSA